MPVFPAHAGMIPIGGGIRGGVLGVPRTRGDDPTTPPAMGEKERVFPAHAGMIPCWSRRCRRPWRVPRTRGDDPR